MAIMGVTDSMEFAYMLICRARLTLLGKVCPNIRLAVQLKQVYLNKVMHHDHYSFYL